MNQKEFFVWIDPEYPTIKYLPETRTISSQESESDNRMFIPNENFHGFPTPFQYNLMSSYLAEYNLEEKRRFEFPRYPSRLDAIFLFETEAEAIKYRHAHIEHVFDRKIKKVISIGSYKFSRHDLRWVDFLIQNLSKDRNTLDQVGNAYWSGHNAYDCELTAGGVPWKENPIIEILYTGTIKFENRDFSCHDIEIDL